MRIAVVGAYGVGWTFLVDRSPRAGETVTARSLTTGHGGKGSNQAVGAARLGAQVDLLTSVGRDAAGQAARVLWEQEGVTAHAVESDAPTMTGAILVEPGGENRIVLAAGAADHVRPADVDAFATSIRRADICLVSLEIPRETAVRALQVARDAGTRTLLNPAPAPDERFTSRELELVDVLTPNLGEAGVLGGGGPGGPDQVVAALRRDYDGVLVVTLGARGALICDSDGARSVTAVPAPDVVDTTGAGDSFTAALAVRLADGDLIDTAVRYAAAAASHAVSVAHVVPSLPTALQVAHALERQR